MYLIYRCRGDHFTETINYIEEIQSLIAKLAFAILGRSRDSIKEYSDRILQILSRYDMTGSRIFSDERRILLSVARKINYQSGKRIPSSNAIEICRICDKAMNIPMLRKKNGNKLYRKVK